MKQIIYVSGSRTGHNFIMNQAFSWFPKNEIKAINYENIKIEDFNRTIHAWQEAGQVDPAQPIYVVLIVRDLLNWWASYLRYVPDVAQRNHQNLFDVWVSHVKEAAGETNTIPMKITMRYCHFNNFKFHRQFLCDKLGGSYSEERIDQVLEAGRGSSFDGTTVPGRLMRTDARYKEYQSHEYYLKMLWENQEALRLYREYFNPLPDKLKIIQAL